MFNTQQRMLILSTNQEIDKTIVDGRKTVENKYRGKPRISMLDHRFFSSSDERSELMLCYIYTILPYMDFIQNVYIWMIDRY